MRQTPFESSPNQTDVLAVAQHLYDNADLYAHDPDAPKGLIFTRGNNGGVTFRVEHSPTTYDSVMLHADSHGRLQIRQQSQRPSLEHEGFGRAFRSETIYPAAPDSNGIPYRTTQVGRLTLDGTFIGESEPTLEVLSVDSPGLCSVLIENMRTLSGYGFEEQVPKPKRLVQSLLGRLGLRRS